ncbi:MAG: IS701 family transposase [Alphaproteobacteria bacterium]|nr:IS701 family transposase [Alphaproteobacteria bacterium]
MAMQGVEDSDRERRFDEYIGLLGDTLHHADRQQPFRNYVTGLLLPGERKSVEPMAARIAPSRVSAEHQSLLTFVSESSWDEVTFLDAVAEQVLPVLTADDGVTAWIVDDTGFPKKGKHSVGVSRQYCGELGKKENCQVAVSLSVATEHASLPIAYRLYLPEDWSLDEEKRKKTKVPSDMTFHTKPDIALDQIWDAVARGLAPGVVLADPAYGNNTDFRDGVTALGLVYAMGIQFTTTVWPPGAGPLPPVSWSGRGRPPTALRRDAEHQPISVKALALGLGAQVWQTVSWREGTNEDLKGRFTRLRVRPAHRDEKRSEPRPEEWLLIEWPDGEEAPTKYWLSTLPDNIAMAELVRVTKMRWRIERDYRELKQELGLGHFEGRGWRGFHHHAALCIAAYGFLVRERIAFPPCTDRGSPGIKASAVPTGYRPRGSAGTARAA